MLDYFEKLIGLLNSNRFFCIGYQTSVFSHSDISTNICHYCGFGLELSSNIPLFCCLLTFDIEKKLQAHMQFAT